MSVFDEIKCEDLLNNFPIKDSLQRIKDTSLGRVKQHSGDVKSL